ncbi:hypothetical protein OG218_24320 [Kineococcus sp. NBC_00420]|uniref:hypothetical protein n=1 Tax=Kineococcus sp. NBC_00420 TaxID=2903564 RepID=UPI002E1F6FBC
MLSGAPDLKEVPPDFYLREMSAFAPSTDDGIVEFVRTWGRTADVFWRDRPAGEEWDNISHHRMEQLRGGDEHLGQRVRREAAGARFGVEERDLVEIQEVRERLSTAKEWADRIRAWQRPDAEPTKTTDNDAYIFAMMLTPALSATQVALDSGGEDYLDSVISRPMVTAYSVAAMQCFNDVMAHTPLLVCHNETCILPDRLFARQRGRAQQGQYRTAGLKYCSKECGKAQGERERRRRVKAMTNKEKAMKMSKRSSE